MLHQYRQHLSLFSRNATLFLIAMTIMAFGTGAPIVFFNLYLEKLGFARTYIGLVSTVIAIGGVLMALPSAFLIDKLGRRRAIFISLVLGLSAWGLSLFTRNATLLLALQALHGVGNVLFGLAVVPIMAENSSPTERATLFSVQEGLQYTALFLGSALFGYMPGWLAPLIGAPAESAEAYRLTLFISIFLRALGLIPFLLMRPKPNNTQPTNTHAPSQTRLAHYFHPRNLIRLKTPIWIFIVPYALVYIGGSLIFPFLSLFLKERFAAPDVTIGYVLGLVNLAIGIGALLAPLAAAQFGRNTVIVGSTLLSAACVGLIGFSPVFYLVAVVIVLRAGVFNLTLPLYKAHVIDHAPLEEYTIVTLILSTSSNIGPTISPIFSGWLQSRAGFAPVFGIAVVCYALAAFAYAQVFKRKTSHQF